MRIIKNTTIYTNRCLRSIICKVHAHMRKLERHPAPNWKHLRVQIAKSKRGYSAVSGYAYFYGCSKGQHPWDVFLGLPHFECTERVFAGLVYHELMHTYGYTHAQYTDLPESELRRLFPENNLLEVKPDAVVQKRKKRVPEYGVFPIKIQMTRHTIDELESAEYGSYEDWCSEGKPTEFHKCHTVEILQRHKTVLELRNETELREVYWAVHTGVFNMRCPGAYETLWSELKSHIDTLEKSN